VELLCCWIFSTSLLLWRSSSCAGFSPRLATTCKEKGSPSMDYIIGGITTLFLFVYLIYALLKPEKF
jgi:K+-transporting ATPase KdpF subunit